jgi:TrmH family RNA methyltransferase
VSPLRSRENPRVRHWRAIAQEARARRESGSTLLEGAHLVQSYLEAGGRPRAILLSESGAGRPELAGLARRAELEPMLLTDALFRWVADARTPAGLAAEIPLPTVQPDLARARHAVFLDGIQDAGNVGAILRSAAAFGVEVAVLGPGCADPWSPKVMRAGMGGHFSLSIAAVDDLAPALRAFHGAIVCAVARGGTAPSALDLSGAVGWVFGSEGAGVSPAAAAAATCRASIALAPGAESLNVAAAAAILLYERARQLSTGAARS